MAIEALDIEIRHSGTESVNAVSRLTSGMESLRASVHRATDAVREYAGSWRQATAVASKAISPKVDVDSFIKSRTEMKMLQQQALDLRQAIEDAITSQSKKGQQMGLGEIDSLVRRYNDVQRKIEELKNGTKELGNEAEKSTGKFSKFFAMIGRMALYRAVRSALRLIAQSIKEGVQNLAKWDYLTGRVSSSRAYDTLQQYGSKFAELKNSIGAAAMPILQMLLPAFNALADGAIRAFNAVNALFSALGGAVKYTAATAETGYNLADSFGAAGGAASKLKATILGFDELNVMNDPTSGGGGGGSSVFGGITESTFEERDLPEWVHKFDKAFETIRESAERIKDAITKIGDSKAWSWVELVFNETIVGLANLFATSVEYLATRFEFIADLFSGDWAGAWESFWNADYLHTFADMLREAHDRIAEFFGGDDGSWSPFVALADGLDAVANAFEKVAKTKPSEIWQSIKDWFSKPITFKEGAIVNIDELLGLDKVREFFSNPIEIESGSILDVDSWLSDVGDKLAKFFAEDYFAFFDNLSAKAKEWWANAKNYIDNMIFGKIKQGMIDALNYVISQAETKINEIIAYINKLPGFNIPEVHFSLIPDLDPPPEQVYEDTKKQLEEASKKSPVQTKGTLNFSNLQSEWQKKFDEMHFKLNVDPTVNVNQSTIDSKFGSSGSSKLQLPMEAKLINWHRDRSVWTTDWDKIDYTANLNNWQRDRSKWTSDWDKIDYTANLNNWQKDPTKWKGDNWNNINFKANLNNWQKDPTKWRGDRWNNIDFGANLNNWQKDPTKWRGDSWNNIDFKANLNNWQKDPNKWKGDSWNNIDFNANIVKVIPPTKTEQISVNAKIDKVITPDGKFTLTKAANGGAFYGGGWHSIPQYADGGSVHGSLFLAGEAGPELVSHVGGRTEVLNSSQLAATMVAAVASAMSGNNALIREQNGLLREMASRESTVRAVVSTTDIASGASRMNRRAGTTIIPVGA